MTNRKHKPRRTAAGASHRDTLRRQIARKIAEWADPHDSCIVPGCRRNKRCLLPEACRGFSDEPLDDETAAIVRRNLRALKAFAEGGPMPDEVPLTRSARAPDRATGSRRRTP